MSVILVNPKCVNPESVHVHVSPFSKEMLSFGEILSFKKSYPFLKDSSTCSRLNLSPCKKKVQKIQMFLRWY